MRVRVEVEGLQETLRAFNQYGKEANKELRAQAGEIVNDVIPDLAAAAEASSPGAALSAPSIKRRSDRVPVVQVGGSRRARPTTRPNRRVTAGDVLFGFEFGGNTRPNTRQFPRHTGRTGYWFWPTLRRHLPRMRARYIRVLEDLADKWGSGG